MTRDEEARDPRLFDRRIVERNIRNGLVTRKDYERFLRSLDDAVGKALQPQEMPAEPAASGEGGPRPGSRAAG